MASIHRRSSRFSVNNGDNVLIACGYECIWFRLPDVAKISLGELEFMCVVRNAMLKTKLILNSERSCQFTSIYLKYLKVYT